MDSLNPIARYLVPLRRWWPIIAGTLVLGLLVTWTTLPEAQPTPEELADPAVEYRATHILIRGLPAATTENLDLVLLLARQGDVANRIDARMGDAVGIPEIEAVTLEADQELGTLSITTVQSTPDLATELVTVYAEELTAFLDERAETSLQDQIDAVVTRLAAFDERIRTLEEEISALPEGDLDRRLLESEVNVLIDQSGELQTELRDLSSEQVTANSTFETLQEASPVSTAASGPQVFEVPDNSLARFALAVVAAVLLGVALVFAVDYLDTRIRTRQDAEDAFGLPVIAELPRRSGQETEHSPLPVRTEPSSATAEAFRALRLAVMLSPRWRLGRQAPTSGGSVGSAEAVSGRGDPATLLVTSALPGEGKSTVVANLAASLAESGQRVLVVDCDFRRSTVGQMLGAAEGPGLREMLDPRVDSFEDLIVPTAVEGVRLVRSGAPGLAPAWFLARSFILVERAAECADVVVFDTGPLAATNEANSLIPSVSAVLVVNRVGKLGKDQARRTTEQLARVNAEVAGIVMVAAEGPKRYNYYGPARPRTAKGEEFETADVGQ